MMKYLLNSQGKTRTFHGTMHFFLFSFIITVLVVIIFFALNAEGQTPPPASGNWEIQDNTLIENRSVNLTGHLIVRAGGVLTLKNVTLSMNCSYNGEFNITVENNGSLICTDWDHAKETQDDMTVIKSNASTGGHRYGFRALAGSRLSMIGVKIQNCGWEDMGYNRGVTVICDNSVIRESIFTGNYMGIIYNGSRGGQLSFCNITGNSLSGAYLINAGQTTIEQCNISGGNGHGVNMYRSHNNTVRSNKISGYYYNQVFWPSYNGSAVLLDNSDHNIIDRNNINSPRARGMWLRRANHNVISYNYFEGNTYTSTMVSFGIGLLNSSHNSIHHNVLHHHFMGVYVNYFSHYNRVENNLINYTVRGLSLGDPVYGLWDTYKGRCDYNYFVNNTVNNTDFHGFIIIEGSSFNYIYNTTFTNAQQRSQSGTIFGFLVDHSDNNTFVHNHFHNNSIFSVAIGLQSSSDSRIANNTIGSDGLNQEAINLYGDCNRNIIENNTIYDREWTISIGSSSNYNVLKYNNVYNCDYGIWIWTGSSNNMISYNRINNTTSPGIGILYWIGSGILERNIAKNNTIWNCSIGIHNDPTSRNVTMINNTVYNCTTGILIEGTWGHRLISGEIYHCQEGIRLDNIFNISVNGPLIYNCTITAINITGCNNTAICNSTFHDNPIVILSRDSPNTMIASNIFFNNSRTTDYDTLTGIRFTRNTIHSQDIGINVLSFGEVYIDNNTFHNNTYGVKFLKEGVDLKNNDFIDNDHGLHFSGIGHCNITGGIIVRNNIGVFADNALGIRLSSCTVSENTGFGIYSTNYAEVTVTDCSFRENRGWGVFSILGGNVYLASKTYSTIDGDRIFLDGDMEVLSGGRLWINDSDIRMGSFGGQVHRIEVKTGGYLAILSSTISKGADGPYRFFAREASSMDIFDSHIVGCGVPARSTPQPGSGLTLEGCSATIKETVFRDSPCGLYSTGGTLAMENVSFSGCEHWLYAVSSNGTLENCTFNRLPSSIVKITFSSSDVIINNCSFPDSGYTMIAKNHGNISVMNTALDASALEADWTSTIIVRYIRMFHFTDPHGSPVPSLEYHISDANGFIVHNGISNNNGNTTPIYLRAFSVHGYAVNDTYNPYTITLRVNSPFGYQSHEFIVLAKGDVALTVRFYPLVDPPDDIEITEGSFLEGVFDLNEVFSDDGEISFSYHSTGNLSVIIHTNGTVDIFTLDPDWYGTQQIMFIATNRFQLSSYFFVNVTVLPVDDPPVITPVENITLQPGESLTLDLSDHIADVDTLIEDLNITVEGEFAQINGIYLYIPYERLTENLEITLFISDNCSFINTSFFVSFILKPIFNPLPDTAVEIDTPYEMVLSDHFDLGPQDLADLVISTSSGHIVVDHRTLVMIYPEDVEFEKVFVFYQIGDVVFVRTLNVTLTGHQPPVFLELPDMAVTAGKETHLDLEDYYDLSAKDEARLEISVMSNYVILNGASLTFLYPEGIDSERIIVYYRLEGSEFSRTINVTVIEENHAPELKYDSLDNIGNNYTFTVDVFDRDGDAVSVSLVLDGNATTMEERAEYPGIFELSMFLEEGPHSYHFKLDDGTGDVNGIVNTSFKNITVSGVAEQEEGSFLGISSDSSLMLLIIIIFVAAIIVLVIFGNRRKRESKREDDVDLEDKGEEKEDDEKPIIKEIDLTESEEEKEIRILLKRGIEFGANKEFMGALSTYDKVISMDSENSNAWHLKGVIYTRMGNCAMAETCMENAVRYSMDPGKFFAQTIVSVMECTIGEEKKKERVKQLLRKGIFFTSKKDYAQALKAYDKVIRMDRLNYDAWYLKAVTYGKMGNQALARNCLEQAARITEELEIPKKSQGMEVPPVPPLAEFDPNESQKWLERGIRYAIKGENEKALRSLDRAIDLDPRDPSAWYQKGSIYDIIGDAGRTEEAFQRFVEFDTAIMDMIEEMATREDAPPLFPAPRLEIPELTRESEENLPVLAPEELLPPPDEIEPLPPIVPPGESEPEFPEERSEIAPQEKEVPEEVIPTSLTENTELAGIAQAEGLLHESGNVPSSLGTPGGTGGALGNQGVQDVPGDVPGNRGAPEDRIEQGRISQNVQLGGADDGLTIGAATGPIVDAETEEAQPMDSLNVSLAPAGIPVERESQGTDNVTDEGEDGEKDPELESLLSLLDE